MGLKKLTGKVADYRQRLESGKASKIKPSHVEKVLEKLRTKRAELEADVADAHDPDKQARLKRKLAIADEHIDRAEWLLAEISSG